MPPVEAPTRSVVFYCPDTHIQYDGRTPSEKGVGGGVTARVRMAKALAKIGHRVTMVVNCPTMETIDGVQYLPLGEATTLEGNVLILNTSGGGLDLTPVQRLPIRSSLVILWASGLQRPQGIDPLPIDLIYAKSNFQRDVVRRDWQVPNLPIFVSYNGFDEDSFRQAHEQDHERDPFRLIYLSHPVKGLAAATQVLRRLRRIDPRYTLHVFGDEGLWGDAKRAAIVEPGVIVHGLVGQRQLAVELERSTFALHLQTIREVFGIALLDSLRAGCVTIASEVGAYPELIQDGLNGYLIPGDPSEALVQDAATEKILECSRSPLEIEDVRRGARSVPWSMEVISKAWTDHWASWFEGNCRVEGIAGSCESCGGRMAQTADGLHCTACGRYGGIETAPGMVPASASLREPQ